jgi:capsular polysaccharide biosynthesis protein
VIAGPYFYGFDAGEAEARLRHVLTTPDPASPAIYRLKDAVALPGIAGLWDMEGRRIDEAATRMLSDDAPALRKANLHKRLPGLVSLPDHFDVVDETVLFGGYLMKHYGHFIIESMSRLWARNLFPALPILFTSPRKWRQPPAYGTDVLTALGLEERILVVDEPTIFRDVVCPATALEYRWKAFSIADEPHTEVAKALDGSSRRRWRRPAYLTRSGLSDELRKSEAEPELESELASRGFHIVRPEELSLAEQISLFESAPLIVGMLGSALHTALFSRSPGTLAVLNWGRGFEHYLLVDGVKQHTAYYLKSMQRRGEAGEHILDVGRTLQLLDEAGLVAAPTRLGFGD